MVTGILQDVGLNCLWISYNVENINWLCRNIKYRLEMQFVQKWNSDVQASPKCINDRIFKTDFKIESYITELQPRLYITLSRFRTTNNRLPMERGRLENVDRLQRFCNLFTGNVLGDEFHYLLECKYFIKDRKKYLPGMLIYINLKLLGCSCVCHAFASVHCCLVVTC